MFLSTLFSGSKMRNRAFMTTSGELGFRHQKSTRDDLLLTDVGVRFPKMTRPHCKARLCIDGHGVNATIIIFDIQGHKLTIFITVLISCIPG